MKAEVSVLPTRNTVQQILKLSRRSLNRTLDLLQIDRPSRMGILQEEEFELLLDYHLATKHLKWEDSYFEERLLEPGLTLKEYLSQNPEANIPHLSPKELCKTLGIENHQLQSILESLEIARPIRGRGFSKETVEIIKECLYANQNFGISRKSYRSQILDQGLNLQECIEKFKRQIGVIKP